MSDYMEKHVHIKPPSNSEAGSINYYLGGPIVPEVQPKKPIFQVHYTDQTNAHETISDGLLRINMSTTDHPVDFTENWWAETAQEAEIGLLCDGLMRFTDLGSDIIVYGTIGTLGALEADVYRSYCEIFQLFSSRGYTRLLRSWNFIPHINAVPENEPENYRTFCAGRARAFEKHQINQLDMPSATGIGTPSTDALCYMIATKCTDYRHVENPLQIPAYEYPRRYGIKSPSFARATLLERQPRDDAPKTSFFLSGTASIRGSETMAEGDLERQIDILMENITCLTAAGNEECQTTSPFSLSDFDHFKVYFRNSDDYEQILEALTGRWKIAEKKLFFMNVDVCRADLLVELEGCVNPRDTLRSSRE
jgi:hypothetical protein